MKKLVFEYEGMTTTIELAIKGTIPFLERKGIEYRIVRAADLTEQDLEWCDLYYAIRPYSFDSYYNAKAAKKAGCFYYVLFDDDLLNWVEGYKGRKEYAKKCLALADVVVSTSPLIAEEYSKYSKTKRYCLIETPIEESEIVSTNCDDKVHLIFAAGQNHEPIFQALIGPVIDDILEKYKGSVDITFVGVHPDLDGINNIDLVNYVGGMSLEEYNQYMRTHHFDIGLAPLEDVWFCNRKYYNKYLEYAKVGICGIYSNCLPYTYIVRNGENGYLANPIPSEWEKVICKAIDDIEMRKQIITNSQSQLLNNFSPEDLDDRMVENIPELLTYQRVENDFELDKSGLSRKAFLIKDRIFRAFYIAKHYGIKEMLDTIIRHLK